MPLEAQRLGLEAYASDLNPVAVLINKAMIELAQSQGLQPSPIASLQVALRLIANGRGDKSHIVPSFC